MATNANDKSRAYAAAHFALALERSAIGLVRSIEGGGMKADVMTYQYGAGQERWRQLGKPKFDDFKLQVGMSMSLQFYQWIEAFFSGNQVRKSGAIVAADFYYAERARREFYEAIIKDLTFPALSASDKQAAYLSVGVAAERIVFRKGDGSKLAGPAQSDQQKLWSACNFNLSVDGFDDACRRVTKIEAFTIKQQIIEHHVGGQREPFKFGSRIDFPNLVFYLPEADAEPFVAHFQQNGVAGARRGTGLTGSLQYLDNEKKPLATLSFGGADIVSITPDRSDASTEEFKTVKVELYTEVMSFVYEPQRD